MKKVFLFDLGNVLAYPIDSKLLYQKLNCKIPYKEFEIYWLGNDLIIKAHKGLVSDDISIKELLNYCKTNLSVEDFYNVYNNLDTSLFLDTVEIINKLKANGYRVGLLSNLRLMDYDRYKEKIEEIDFDYLFLSYEMNSLKPDDKIFKKVIESCNCKPSEIVFFDDNERNVIAANRNGINCYKTSGYNIKKVFEEIFNV